MQAEQTCRKEIRDNKGRFKKGFSGNPVGNNQFTSIVPLLEALKKEGEKRSEDFWAMVARKAFINDAILIAILKKLIADKKELTGEGLRENFKIIVINANANPNSHGLLKRLRNNA